MKEGYIQLNFGRRRYFQEAPGKGEIEEYSKCVKVTYDDEASVIIDMAENVSITVHFMTKEKKSNVHGSNKHSALKEPAAQT